MQQVQARLKEFLPQWQQFDGRLEVKQRTRFPPQLEHAAHESMLHQLDLDSH